MEVGPLLELLHVVARRWQRRWFLTLELAVLHREHGGDVVVLTGLNQNVVGCYIGIPQNEEDGCSGEVDVERLSLRAHGLDDALSPNRQRLLVIKVTVFARKA